MSDRDPAAVLYGQDQTTPAAPLPERQRTHAEVLYGAGGGTLEGADLEPLYRAVRLQGVDVDRDALAEGFKREAGALGFGRSDTETLAGLIASAIHNPPDETQLLAWEEDTERLMKARDLGADAERARQLMAAQAPGLQDLLVRAGLGNNPRALELVLGAIRRRTAP